MKIDPHVEAARLLHILRNPWGHSEEAVREARLWAADSIESFAAEVERLKRDAERYQWLRPRLYSVDFCYGEPPKSVIAFEWPNVPIGADLSAAIDAARAGAWGSMTAAPKGFATGGMR